jgi:hypothetical protein
MHGYLLDKATLRHHLPQQHGCSLKKDEYFLFVSHVPGIYYLSKIGLHLFTFILSNPSSPACPKLVGSEKLLNVIIFNYTKI